MKPSDYYNQIYNRTADWQKNRFELGFAPYSKVVLPLVSKVPPGNAVLDIGCQAGHMLRLVRSRFKHAYGIDIAGYEEDWKLHEYIEFKVHDVDAAPLPYADNSISLVLCTNVLEHVFDVFGLVSEISRVLEPGGYCIIMVPNCAYIKHIISLLRGRVPRTGAQKYPFTIEDGWDGCHLHYFTPSELEWLLSNCNITTLSMHSSGNFQKLRHLWKNILFADIVLLGRSTKLL